MCLHYLSTREYFYFGGLFFSNSSFNYNSVLHFPPFVHNLILKRIDLLNGGGIQMIPGIRIKYELVENN